MQTGKQARNERKTVKTPLTVGAPNKKPQSDRLRLKDFVEQLLALWCFSLAWGEGTAYNAITKPTNAPRISYITPQRSTFQGLEGNFTPSDLLRRPMSRFGGILKCSVRMGFSQSGEPEAADEYQLTGRLENVHNVNQLTQAVQDLRTAKRAIGSDSKQPTPHCSFIGQLGRGGFASSLTISPTAKRNRP